MRFQHSYLGTAFERNVPAPDWVLDYWHPLEKAQYPDYFACRELRKEEFIKAWDAKYRSDPCEQNDPPDPFTPDPFADGGELCEDTVEYDPLCGDEESICDDVDSTCDDEKSMCEENIIPPSKEEPNCRST